MGCGCRGAKKKAAPRASSIPRVTRAGYNPPVLAPKVVEEPAPEEEVVDPEAEE